MVKYCRVQARKVLLILILDLGGAEKGMHPSHHIKLSLQQRVLGLSCIIPQLEH
jgi:hypothetical protein